MATERAKSIPAHTSVPLDDDVNESLKKSLGGSAVVRNRLFATRLWLAVSVIILAYLSYDTLYSYGFLPSVRSSLKTSESESPDFSTSISSDSIRANQDLEFSEPNPGLEAREADALEGTAHASHSSSASVSETRSLPEETGSGSEETEAHPEESAVKEEEEEPSLSGETVKSLEEEPPSTESSDESPDAQNEIGSETNPASESGSEVGLVGSVDGESGEEPHQTEEKGIEGRGGEDVLSSTASARDAESDAGKESEEEEEDKGEEKTPEGETKEVPSSTLSSLASSSTVSSSESSSSSFSSAADSSLSSSLSASTSGSSEEEEERAGEGETEGESLPPGCEGKAVYIYKLPSVFNKALLENCASILPWYNMCPHLESEGVGGPYNDYSLLVPLGKWFHSHTYSLEVLFHYRLRRSYPCVTLSPSLASLFFVPFYASLDMMRKQFEFAVEEEEGEEGGEAGSARGMSYRNKIVLRKRDKLLKRLASWLGKQESFKNSGGSDHFMVMSRSSWDFRRNDNSDWGNTLLLMPEFKKVHKLMSEANIYDPSEISIPQISHFHPKKGRDVKAWQSVLSSRPRTHLLAFARFKGGERRAETYAKRMCQKGGEENCKFLECASDGCMSNPGRVMEVYSSAVFCLHVPGDIHTRRGVFDAFVAGCIPIFFDKYIHEQYKTFLPSNPNLYSITLPLDYLADGGAKLAAYLQEFPQEKVPEMRNTIVKEILPSVIYNHPRYKTGLIQHRDAFDLSMDALLKKVGQEASIE